LQNHYLGMAVVYLVISQSLPRKRSTCHSIKDTINEQFWHWSLKIMSEGVKHENERWVEEIVLSAVWWKLFSLTQPRKCHRTDTVPWAWTHQHAFSEDWMSSRPSPDLEIKEKPMALSDIEHSSQSHYRVILAALCMCYVTKHSEFIVSDTEHFFLTHVYVLYPYCTLTSKQQISERKKTPYF
jgi:hypothetical protein